MDTQDSAEYLDSPEFLDILDLVVFLDLADGLVLVVSREYPDLAE